MDRRNDRALRARAEAVIPGGMFGHQSTALLPDDYPQYFVRARGAHLWDADGARVLDMMCAYGPNLFGYGDEAINGAFIAQLREGDTMTGPAPVMVELAETLVDMIGHADWALFCKNGGDATTMALTVARAQTRRKTVIRARGAYHGSAPWCTPRTAGVLDTDRANQILCEYNDVASLEAAVEAAVEAAGEDLAAIFATPFRHDAFVDQAEPEAAYAARARALCDRTGALLVLDEVRTGFRLSRDCAWSRLGVEPDLSTWGKGLANGHAISALLGSDSARAGAEAIYATGSFWCQAAPMAAALATLRRVRETDYLERLESLGERLAFGLAERAGAAGFDFRITGPGQMPLFLFDEDTDLRKGFFWSSAMLEQGVYVHPWHNMFLCDAMTEEDIDHTLDAAEKSFTELRRAASRLAPVAKMAFLAQNR